MNDGKKTFYEVAGLTVAIEGENKYAEAMRKYFQTEMIAGVKDKEHFLIRVNVETDKKDFEPKYYSLSAKIAFNEKEYRVKKDNFTYRVKNLFDKDKVTVLDINWTRTATICHWLRNHIRAKRIGVYSNADYFVDSVMNYEVFLYIFAMVLMKYNKVFVHCGIVTYKEQAIVMTGTSGCGKTSGLLQFLDSPLSKYIADDFGILSEKGAFFIPKKVAIYQSDAKYKNKNIIKALKGLSLKEKISWNVFRTLGLNPRYRFEPYRIFGDAGICKFAEVSSIAYIARSNVVKTVRYEIGEEQLIEKITSASFRELRELYEILYNIRAVGNEEVNNTYPSLEQLQNDYKEILEKSLKGHELCLIEVPVKAAPTEIVETLLGD